MTEYPQSRECSEMCSFRYKKKFLFLFFAQIRKHAAPLQESLGNIVDKMLNFIQFDMISYLTMLQCTRLISLYQSYPDSISLSACNMVIGEECELERQFMHSNLTIWNIIQF